MLYYLLKFLLNIFYRVYYRMSFRNLHLIPPGKAVIIAPNHTNAFIDPTIFAMLLRQEVFFFARSDVFNTPFKKRLMNAMNIHPMYRIQEGYSEVKKNNETFEICRKLLSKNHSVILFPEGICIHERRVRKLKKGLARIAFNTEEFFDFKKDLLVVPVGLNYSEAKKFRSKLFIDCGQPISMKDYEEQYKSDKVRTINELTRVLEEKMKDLLVVIDNPDNDQLVEGIEEIYLSEWMKNDKLDPKNMGQETDTRKKIASFVNHLDKVVPEFVNAFKEKTTLYLSELKTLGIRDHLLRKESVEAMSGLSFINDFLIMWFGIPLYFLLLILHYPPYYFAKKYVLKNVKNIEFHASVHSNLAMVIWLVYYILQLVTVALFFHHWQVTLAYACLMPLSAKFCLLFFPVKKKIMGRWKLMSLVKKDRKKIELLMYQRTEIVKDLENAIAEFYSKK